MIKSAVAAVAMLSFALSSAAFAADASADPAPAQAHTQIISEFVSPNTSNDAAAIAGVQAQDNHDEAFDLCCRGSR